MRRRLRAKTLGSVAAAVLVTAWNVSAQLPGSRAAADSRVAVVDGFDTPESARYDTSADLYYVSNVSGHPTAADNT